MSHRCVVALRARLARCGDYCSRLPHRFVQVGFPQFLDVDAVDSARRAQCLRCDFAFDAHHKARAGEGMPHEEVFRYADVAADAARGILDAIFKWSELRHGEGDADIVVHFYLRDARTRRMPEPAFAQVGVESTLRNEISPERFYFLFEHVLVDIAHREALLTHIRLAAKRREEPFRCVHDLNRYPILVVEIFSHVRLIIGSVDAADVDAEELSALAAKRFFQQICDDGRIRTAGKRYQDFLVPDLLPQFRNFSLRRIMRGEAICDSADLKAEVLIHARAFRRLRHFGVELDAPQMRASCGVTLAPTCFAHIWNPRQTPSSGIPISKIAASNGGGSLCTDAGPPETIIPAGFNFRMSSARTVAGSATRQ